MPCVNNVASNTGVGLCSYAFLTGKSAFHCAFVLVCLLAYFVSEFIQIAGDH